MCYRPIKIYNRSLHFDPLSQPTHFIVPCGKCEACRNSRRNEWFARCYYHWIHVKKHGGQGFFYTLTFNSENLPLIDGKPCFDKSKVQRFVKRLKERLMRKYGVRVDVLITCEYGELYARPHFHAIFFVDKSIPPFILYQQVSESWSYGFVYSGKNGGQLTDCTGILYVTKYITKDIDFDLRPVFLHFALKHYRLFLNGLSSFDYTDDLPKNIKQFLSNKPLYLQNELVRNSFNSFMREYSRFVPFNCHSNFLGISALNMPNHLFENKGLLLIPKGKVFDTIPLPRYLQRALWYDKVPNERDGKFNRFILNNRGRIHKLEKFDEDIERLSREYRDFNSTFDISDAQFKMLSPFLPSFSSKSDLLCFIRGCDLNLRKVAIYKLLLRGRYASMHIRDPFDHPKNLYFHFLTTPEDKSLYPLDFFRDQKCEFFNTFERLETYAPYEFYLNVYESIIHFQSELYYKRKLEIRKISRQIRDNIKLTQLQIPKNYVTSKDLLSWNATSSSPIYV